jgi:hypothetical protein
LGTWRGLVTGGDLGTGEGQRDVVELRIRGRRIGDKIGELEMIGENCTFDMLLISARSNKLETKVTGGTCASGDVTLTISSAGKINYLYQDDPQDPGWETRGILTKLR